MLPLHTDWLQQLFLGSKAQSWLFWHCHSRIVDQLIDILLDINRIILKNLFSLIQFLNYQYFISRDNLILLLPSYHIPPYSSMRWWAFVTPNRSNTLPNLRCMLKSNQRYRPSNLNHNDVVIRKSKFIQYNYLYGIGTLYVYSQHAVHSYPLQSQIVLPS